MSTKKEPKAKETISKSHPRRIVKTYDQGNSDIEFTSRQHRGIKFRGTARLVFSYHSKILKIIETGNIINPNRKARIVESELNTMVKRGIITNAERYNVKVEAEHLPPSTFLSLSQPE